MNVVELPRQSPETEPVRLAVVDEAMDVDLKDHTANPAPLGLLAFGLTTVLLNMHNAGWFTLGAMILGMGIFYGGLAQIIAGIMEWQKGNTFGTTAFVSYGFFWLPLTGMVNVPGSYQAQAGCPGDWQPECAATAMTMGEDGLYISGPFNITAGDYEFKIALDGSWTTNYGSDGAQDGPNYAINVPADGTIEFVYDPATKLVTATVK